MAIDPYLEGLLESHYRRRVRGYLLALAICALAAGAVVAWVLLATPEDGWLSKPVALVGVPAAFGTIVLAALTTIGDRRRVLRWLRDGRELRSVRRGVTVIERKPNSMIQRRVPTIFVEFEGDRASKIMSTDPARLDRIERLLRKQLSGQVTT